LGLKLVTIGELDTHREESPELIGSEAVEGIGEAGEMFWSEQKSWNYRLAESGTSFVSKLVFLS
jgi:hypothetical protein